MAGSFKTLIATGILASAMAASASLPTHPGTAWWQSESATYREGRAALDQGRWGAAVTAFERAVSDDDPADGALYWLAYARNRNGDAAEAMAALDNLEDRYPESAWRDDARALRQEIVGSRSTSAGASPPDEELKLMALNSLMHNDEASAVPILEEFLEGDHGTRLKSRALFVLAQSDAPQAQQVLARIARDGSDEELQRKAIQYLGVHDSPANSALLEELYASLTSIPARRAVLHAFMVADERERLLNVARNETEDELRGRAVHWLGTMEADEELWSLYQDESSLEVKKKILHAFFVGDAVTRLGQIAQNTSEDEAIRRSAIHWLGVSEQTDTLWELYQRESSIELKERILHGFFLSEDTERLTAIARDSSEAMELRRKAIHNLGISDEDASRPVLLSIYREGGDAELRERVLHSLFIQDAGSELIELYRGETDPELKKKALHWLSLIDSEETREFMLEILRR